MGFRFRKSIKVAPGVRVNLNKRGVSATAGVKGAHYTVGTRGRRTTVGIPGTGAYYTSQHRWASSKGRRTSTSAAQRQAERAQRLEERMAKAGERERSRLYAEHRAAEADHMSQDVSAHVDELRGVLAHGLSGGIVIDFSALKDHRPPPSFQIPDSLATPARPPTLESLLPKPLGWIARRFPSKCAAYEQAITNGRTAFEQASAAVEHAEQERLKSISRLQEVHERAVRLHDQRQLNHNAEIDQFELDCRRGMPQAVARYSQLVLQENSDPHLPNRVAVTVERATRTATAERELPPVDVVPEEERFRYIKAQDEIRPVKRSASERKTLYAELIASVALRTAHDLLAATDGQIDVCIVRGFVDTIQPETGLAGHTFLSTLTVTRDAMVILDLRYVDPVACLRELGGKLSRNPIAYQSI